MFYLAPSQSILSTQQSFVLYIDFTSALAFSRSFSWQNYFKKQKTYKATTSAEKIRDSKNGTTFQRKATKTPPFHAPSPSPFPFPSQIGGVKLVKWTRSIRPFVRAKIEVENEISYKDQRTKKMVDAPNSTLVNLAKEFFIYLNSQTSSINTTISLS